MRGQEEMPRRRGGVSRAQRRYLCANCSAPLGSPGAPGKICPFPTELRTRPLSLRQTIVSPRGPQGRKTRTEGRCREGREGHPHPLPHQGQADGSRHLRPLHTAEGTWSIWRHLRVQQSQLSFQNHTDSISGHPACEAHLGYNSISSRLSEILH